MIGKPTPTQAEADAHARGEHVEEHEWDGSPIQYGSMPGAVPPPPPAEIPIKAAVITEAVVVKVEEKVAEAEPEKASYKTRSSKPSEK